MAELVSIKRNVDVSPGQAAPAVFHCSQGDVGSKIILGLLDNGTAYSIPSGVTVTIEGSESNGSIFTPISATASGSDITFYLTGEMTAVAGPAICQAVLKSGSNILGTANFTLEVESSPMGADAPPVFTDAGWTWMLNKLNTEFVPALGNETIIDAIDGKLDKNQGTVNAGKYLKVGTDGNVTTAELDVTTDKTLSIADKAADAKAVGDEITDLKADLNERVGDLKSAILQNGIYDIFVDGSYTNSTWRGIQLTWSGKVATLSGQATDGDFTSPNIFANTSAFPENIFAGDVINVNFSQRAENVYLNIFSYVNGDWTNECRFYSSAKYPIPSNATGLLMRLFVYDTETVNGNVEFSITKSAIVKNQEQVVPTVLPGGEVIAETIEALLTQYGIVILGKGTYKLKKPITMPNNSAISGAGEATVIQAAQGKDAIIAGASCTIENVKIHSNDGHTQSAGTSAGIRVSGNYDTPPLKYNIKISNVTIDGFSLAGIYGTKTGTWVGDSISAINCTIFRCYAGIFLEDYSEFGRYTNIMCRDNYVGVLNKSGNNVFENCSFSNNVVGVCLIGDDGDNSRNNGHGTLVGCTINHSNDNNGFAVICRDISNGFVFNSCQVWYGKIQVEQSNGIIFDGCMFGAYNTNTEIINYTANDLFLMNCLFKVGATFNGSGGETHAINCFKFDGTPVTI